MLSHLGRLLPGSQGSSFRSADPHFLPLKSFLAQAAAIYGIEGIITFTLEGRKIEIGPGEALCIPRGAVREIAVVAKAAAGGPPDPVALAEVMRRHGLTPAA
jgi:hypothetical protein